MKFEEDAMEPADETGPRASATRPCIQAAAAIVTAAMITALGAAQANAMNYFVMATRSLSNARRMPLRKANAAADQQDVCRAYIEGVVDGAINMSDSLGRETNCPPRDAQSEQLREIVEGYLKAHVERRQYTAGGLVLSAIAEAFHCVW